MSLQRDKDHHHPKRSMAEGWHLGHHPYQNYWELRRVEEVVTCRDDVLLSETIQNSELYLIGIFFAVKNERFAIIGVCSSESALENWILTDKIS